MPWHRVSSFYWHAITLIGVEGDFKLGLNEVQMSITMPQYGVELARGRLQAQYYNRAVINAEILTPGEAVIAGLLDKVVGIEQLMDCARAEAIRLASLDRQAFVSTKLKLRHELLQKIGCGVHSG
jgi:enoyl-CoA hydratase/carnithine racemase